MTIEPANRPKTPPSPAPPPDPAGLPHPLTFFLTAGQRQRVLCALRQHHADRTKALLSALRTTARNHRR